MGNGNFRLKEDILKHWTTKHILCIKRKPIATQAKLGIGETNKQGTILYSVNKLEESKQVCEGKQEFLIHEK